MTDNEPYTRFLADLAITPRTWRLIDRKNPIHGGIRQGVGKTYRCPLTAVVLLTTGRSVEVYDASAAGIDALHLPTQLALAIRLAADNCPGADQCIRHDLLAACGLLETPTQAMIVMAPREITVLDASTNGCPTR